MAVLVCCPCTLIWGSKRVLAYKNQYLLKAIRNIPEGYKETPEPGVIGVDDNVRYMEAVDPDEGNIPIQVLHSHEISELQHAGDSEASVQGDSTVGPQTQDHEEILVRSGVDTVAQEMRKAMRK